jgi:DNA-binding response OmpR family regulator
MPALKILIVNSELEVRMDIALMLTNENYELLYASDGEEASELLEASRYGAVICDYKMPKINGVDLLKSLRARKDFTPFVYLSEVTPEVIGLQLINLGAYALLSILEMPKIPEVLKEALKRNEEIKSLLESSHDETKEFVNILHSA